MTSCFDDLCCFVRDLAFVELRVGPDYLGVTDVYKNHFLETWTRDTKDNLAVIVCLLCEPIFQHVIVFNLFAKIRSVSDLLFLTIIYN